MIRVLITGPAHDGRLPYRIETTGTRLATPYQGLDANPLYHACRKLQEWGVARDEAVIGLFNAATDRIQRQTTVGYGANFSDPTGGMPSGAPPATPEELLPPQHRSPAPRDETDLAAALSGTPGQSHHKHPRAGSGARRGQR